MSRAESFLKRHVPASGGVKPVPKVSSSLSIQNTSGQGRVSDSKELPAWARGTVGANSQNTPPQATGTTHQRGTPQRNASVNLKPSVIPMSPMVKVSSIGGVVAVCLMGIGILAWLANTNEGEVVKSSASSGLSSREIDGLVTSRVFAIFTNDGTGSGFPLTKNDVLTNRHVVEDVGEGAEVKVYNETWPGIRTGRVHWISKKCDMAWIVMDQPLPTDPLPIARSRAVRGDQVYAYGYPKQAYRFGTLDNLKVRGTAGVISASGLLQEGVNHYEHTADINNGNSGGPLFNAKGEVIGVNTWMFKDANGAYYAIEIDELKRVFHSLWDKAHGRTPNYCEFVD